MSFEKIIFYTFVGLFCLFIVIISRIVPTLAQIPKYYAWKKIAETIGLTFIHGVFFNTIGGSAPQITGTYRQRAILITADTYEKIGFFNSFTHIMVSIKNLPTSSLPEGGIFYAGCADLQDYFFEEYQNRDSGAISFSSYRIYSLPESLGNFINGTPSFQKIVSGKRFSGLIIKEQRLHLRIKNVDSNLESAHILLDNVCDVAETFEEYSAARVNEDLDDA